MHKLPYKKLKRAADDGPSDEPTLEQQLAFVVVKEEELASDGEDCELHVYETKYDTRGEEVILRGGTRSEIKPPKRRSHRACLVLNRQYSRQAKVLYTELEIQSRYVINALRDIIGTYHGIDFTANPVTIMEPPRCLFHYQDELRRYADKSSNKQEKAHIQLCLQYMEKSLHREIKLLGSSDSPELEFRDLWIAFKPGCLVYDKFNDTEYVSRLRSIHEVEDENDEINSWSLTLEDIVYSGADIGFAQCETTINRYSGCKPVHELVLFPLRLHPDEDRIRSDLLKRGRKFLSLYGTHHCFFDGMASMKSIEDTRVRSRIMLDSEQYKRTVAFTARLISGRQIFTSGASAIKELSGEDIMTCNAYVPGYSLEDKQWGKFPVAKITEVPYNDKAFAGLVLEQHKKRLISSLLERQDCQQDDGFDDLIQGKGKGLIFLLHGPPGVGKTYTAESIADHTRRPLMKAYAAEVYGAADIVEKRLADLFLLATRWKAILLLDEADVYMQDRSLHDLHTNQLVSTLLRVLEYYEGILFLTTNREHTIDHAFRSRIHLFIAYPSLSPDARRELWNSSIVRANRGQTPHWLSTEFLNDFAQQDVNGREIKNVVRVGHSFARNARRELEMEDLLQGMYALKQYESDFGQFSEQGNGGEAAEPVAHAKLTNGEQSSFASGTATGISH
ncbi:MAG: hypothetical protein Q9170_006423 [Blastenia crenularia]